MKYTICITFVVVAVAAFVVVVLLLNQHQKHRFLTAITSALYPDTVSFVTRQ
jgi:hypothetical protein